MADKLCHSFGWCRLSVFLVGRHVGPHCRHVGPCAAALSGRILLKLGTNIHHVRGHCWTGFQGQRSTVKVTAGPNSLFLVRNTHRITTCRLLSMRRRQWGILIDAMATSVLVQLVIWCTVFCTRLSMHCQRSCVSSSRLQESLQRDLTSAPALAVFRKRLKTYLFPFISFRTVSSFSSFVHPIHQCCTLVHA